MHLLSQVFDKTKTALSYNSIAGFYSFYQGAEVFIAFERTAYEIGESVLRLLVAKRYSGALLKSWGIARD